MAEYDPFAGMDPEEFDAPALPSLKTKKVGDFFVGKVTKVGSVFQGKTFDGTPGDDTYAIELELKTVSLTTVPEDENFPYTPPVAGEVATWFVPVGKHKDKIIEAAARRAGVNGVEVGDELAIKFIEKVKTDKPYAFHKHAAIIKPAPRTVSDDPFASGADAPF